ncbi:MAG TPA: SGNH/GDSL hydrolase family protein [Xanthobacteraceae bacterium]|nr:SGNH/GDSL hydrolase family protein [Xanthobacteraceae bacterium]
MTTKGMTLNRLSAAAAALVLSCLPLQAADDDACYVPPFLVEPQAALHRVAEAVKRDNKLSIAIVSGSPSQVGGTKGRRSYPSYLEAALKKRMPDIEVKIDVRAKARRPAADLLKLLPGIAEESVPSLVIWQIGTVDALQQTDVDAFARTVEQGLAAIADRGADAVLLNMQYSPRTDRLVDYASYLDTIREAADTAEVPLFDRYEIMRYWNVAGTFDLTSLRDDGLYEKIHTCIGELLADFILRGAGMKESKGIGG